MDWKKLAGDVANLAPGIGAAIGGPYGTIAGMGIKAIAGVFGIDTDTDQTEEQVKVALKNMTPEQAMQLKAADKQFQIDMEKLGVDVFKLEVEDRDSARKMQMATKSLVPAVLTGCFVFLATAVSYVVFNKNLEASGIDMQLVGIIIGYVFSELKTATSFWMGSSKGSQDKTLHIGEMMKK